MPLARRKDVPGAAAPGIDGQYHTISHFHPSYQLLSQENQYLHPQRKKVIPPDPLRHPLPSPRLLQQFLNSNALPKLCIVPGRPPKPISR